MTVLIISGVPGAGKSAMASWLAPQFEQSVVVRTDDYFDNVTRLIDPSTPASRSQNTTIVRAYASAAREFAEGGYTVLIDGVVGPWWFDELNAVLGGFHYAVLAVPAAELKRRVRERENHLPVAESMVDRMYPQFAEIAQAYPESIIDNNGEIKAAGTALLCRYRSGQLRVSSGKSS